MKRSTPVLVLAALFILLSPGCRRKSESEAWNDIEAALEGSVEAVRDAALSYLDERESGPHAEQARAWLHEATEQIAEAEIQELLQAEEFEPVVPDPEEDVEAPSPPGVELGLEWLARREAGDRPGSQARPVPAHRFGEPVADGA